MVNYTPCTADAMGSGSVLAQALFSIKPAILMNWPLILNILLMYGILVLVNVPAPFLGLEFESDSATSP